MSEDKSVKLFDVVLNEAIIIHNHPLDVDIYHSFGEDGFTFMKNNSTIKSLRITTPIYAFEINIKKNLDISYNPIYKEALQMCF